MILDGIFKKKSKKTAILVIDDEAPFRNLLKDALRTPEREVHAAPDGASGIKAALELRPALILLDLMMPAVSGYDVLKELRARAETKDIPVLVLTARTLLGEAERAFSLGAKATLHKPIDMDRLCRKVASMIAA